jgi:uracil-DNA glycosylase
MAALPGLQLVLAVGGAAQAWHLGTRSVTQAVAEWRSHAARGIWPLPHPSWRTTGWLRRHPWFEAELLPALRVAVRDVMEDDG